jgi:hypothetical protein
VPTVVALCPCFSFCSQARNNYTNNIQQQLLGQHLIDMCKHVQATNCQSPDKKTHSLRGIIVKLAGAPVTKKGFGPELAMSDDRQVDNTSGHFVSEPK